MRKSETIDWIYKFPTEISIDSHGVASMQWTDAGGAFGQRDELTTMPNIATARGFPNAFTSAECAIVRSMGEALPRSNGRVEVGDELYRVSHIAWITPNEENHWLFHKLGVLFAQANKYYGFELTGFVEALQFTSYGTGQHFDWHVDIGVGQTSARKLSLSIQLSEMEDYDGGHLEFTGISLGNEARQIGTAIFFPSYLAHRVKPVTSGQRRSLVAWAYGPAFR